MTIMAYKPKSLPIALAGLTLAAPQIASACHNVTLCFAWPAELEDQEYGEAHIVGEEVPAHGARVTLIRPPPEVALNRILDDNGCVTFETQFAFGHTAVLYAEAWIGSNTTTWHFKTLFEESPDQIEKEPRNWVAFVPGIAQEDLVNLDVKPNESLPIAEIMAITTVIMKRFVELGVLPAPLDGPPDFTMWYAANQEIAVGSCPGLTIGKGRYRNKNVVGHEFGHWLQCLSAGLLNDALSYDYGEDGVPQIPAAPCLFFDDAHALRSTEWSASAMGEGFAHFISAVLFNNHLASDAEGIFRYYKTKFPNEEYMDLVDDDYRVSLPGIIAPLGGGKRWAENSCSADWANEGVSSEIDWLRFFWYFLTEGDQDRPLLGDVLGILADTKDMEDDMPLGNKKNTFIKIRTAVSENWPQFLTRLDDADTEMGVFNTNAVP
jgi:hypothetical protein